MMGDREQVTFAGKLVQHDIGKAGGEMTPVGDGHLRVVGAVEYVNPVPGRRQTVTPVVVVDKRIGRGPPSPLTERLPLDAMPESKIVFVPKLAPVL